MKLDTALYQLRTQPQIFLQNNLLVLAGAGQSGVRMNYFSYDDGAAPGVNESFTIQTYRKHTARTGMDFKTHTALSVHNVRMIPNSEHLDVSAIEPYVLGPGGPDIMVTGQLSACIFCVQQQPGGFVVAHIQPGGARQTGATLRQTIKLMGRFAGHGRVTHVFGIGRDYTTKAYVVGVRQGGTWRIFGQRVADSKGPIQGVTQIV